MLTKSAARRAHFSQRRYESYFLAGGRGQELEEREEVFTRTKIVRKLRRMSQSRSSKYNRMLLTRGGAVSVLNAFGQLTEPRP